MNDYLNQLRALMDFYDQNGPRTPDFGGYTDFSNDATRSSDRLNFALQQMDRMNRLGGGSLPQYQPAPNFFNFGAQAPAAQGSPMTPQQYASLPRVNSMALVAKGR